MTTATSSTTKLGCQALRAPQGCVAYLLWDTSTSDARARSAGGPGRGHFGSGRLQRPAHPLRHRHPRPRRPLFRSAAVGGARQSWSLDPRPRIEIRAGIAGSLGAGRPRAHAGFRGSARRRAPFYGRRAFLDGVGRTDFRRQPGRPAGNSRASSPCQARHCFSGRLRLWALAVIPARAIPSFPSPDKAARRKYRRQSAAI